MNRRTLTLLAVILAIAGGCVSLKMTPTPPSSLSDGQLKPCPTSPNCVCSQDPNPERRIPPLHVSGSAAAALDRLKKIIAAERGSRIVESRPEYLWVEYRSRFFKFVDDVEFLVNPTANTVEVRSASRVGYSDFGVNRRRIERLRVALAQQPTTH